MESIKDKSVVITGASSGIGAEIARDLGRHGVNVTLGARRVERLNELAEEVRAAGGQAEVCATDVTRREQVEGLVAAAEQAFGRVDVLVNNAGLMPLSLMEKIHVDEWERMVDVNVKGVLYGVAAALLAIYFTAVVVKSMRVQLPKYDYKVFKHSIVYLSLLFLVMFVDVALLGVQG